MGLLQRWESLGIWGTKLSRIRDSKKELRLKGKLPHLSSEEINIINQYWGGRKLDYKYFSLYKQNGVIDPRYIPDDLYYSEIDTYFNDPIVCRYVDDKNLYNLLFPDVKQPKTIGRKEHGLYISAAYEIIDEAYIVKECKKAFSVVIKKSANANGGESVYFWRYNNSEESIDELKKLLHCDYDFVIQECLKQHSDIARLHPSSINTIRILTLNWKGEIFVLSAIIRIGANGASVDNGHSGGIFCGIDRDGQLKDCAYTYMTGKMFKHTHPTTGAVFSDCTIPSFQQCKNLVKKLAPRLSSFSRLTSWDLSVDESGEPVLIEVNLAYGGLFFHQIANGPVFGDLTKDIITEAL